MTYQYQRTKPTTPGNYLFVYGIFLDQSMRDHYGMYDAHYATVMDYITVGHKIVQAEHLPDIGAALTGMLLQVDPRYWGDLDDLESNYDRIIITTTDGDVAYMYAEKQSNNPTEGTEQWTKSASQLSLDQSQH